MIQLNDTTRTHTTYKFPDVLATLIRNAEKVARENASFPEKLNKDERLLAVETHLGSLELNSEEARFEARGHLRAKLTAQVPYAQSKLTQLLARSLGGDGQALVVACVSPAARDRAASLHALATASALRSVRSFPAAGHTPPPNVFGAWPPLGHKVSKLTIITTILMPTK